MRRASIPLIAVVGAVLVAGLAGYGQRASAPPIAVLFVGNSYTYYNNLPCMVAEFGRSRGRRVDVSMSASGGLALRDHLRAERTRDLLSIRTWTHVVLQEQSTFGVTYLVDGLERVADVSSLERDTTAFAALIRKAGARPILAGHWKRRDVPDRDGLALRRAFAAAGAATRSDVAPVGLAWDLVSREHPDVELYDADGSHPSPEGSYLAAATIYATLTGESAVDLPRSITCAEVDHDSGRVGARLATRTLEPSVSSALQAGASTALREWARAPPVVPPIALPELPEGEPLRGRAMLEGVWEGRLTLYPRWLPWPATMTLVVPPSGESARLTVAFGGKPDDIVREVSLSLEDGRVRFVDPTGPNGTSVEYRGVLRSGILNGVGEFKGDDSLYGIGTWTLERRR